MKRSTKTISIILIFFLIIAAVIIGRTMIGNHFKKKFSKRPPPGIIVTEVVKKEFAETIDILANRRLGNTDWIEFRSLKDGWGAFKEIHDGTCTAPKIVLIP